MTEYQKSPRRKREDAALALAVLLAIIVIVRVAS
jgi:hypothetical protein